MEIEGIPLKALKALSNEEQDVLLAFGHPLTFRFGSANILAEFNRSERELLVNLAHIDGGGEGIMLLLWKALEDYAAVRGYEAVQWNIRALTCANPNPRLQRFLYAYGFVEVDHIVHGRILSLKRVIWGSCNPSGCSPVDEV